MDLGKHLRQGVRNLLWPSLKDQGFTVFSDLAAWRKGDRWIDCVQVTTLGATRFGVPNVIGRRGPTEILANAATFSLEIGCYYTDLHRLPWTGPVPECPRMPHGESAQYPTCHRQRSLARSFGYGNVQGTLFPSADDGSDMDRVLDDALQALRSRGLAWLETTHDIDAYLARVDLDPREYNEGARPVEFTEEERTEIAAWMTAREKDVSEVTMWNRAFGEELPPPVRRKLEENDLRDHTAMGSLPPSGDLYYGLLIGNGRRDEVVEALKRDNDPRFAEARYEEILLASGDKRWANRERKFWESRLLVEREHLAMLLAMDGPE